MAKHSKVKPNREVSSWVKNFTKSIGYSATSILKEDIMPTTFDNISSAKDIALEMKDDLLGSLLDISPGSGSSIDASAIGKESRQLFKDALNDIRTGKFASAKVEDDFTSDMESDFGIDMDFESISIEDENGTVSNSVTVSNDAKLTSRAILEGAEYSTDAMNKMTIAMMSNATQNARAQTKSSQKTALMAVNTLGSQLLGIQHRIDALNATAGTIVDFLRESQAQANEKAIAHYARMEEAIAKEITILGQQQAATEKNLSKELRKNGFNSSIYMKQLRNNIENSDWYTNIELISSMAEMVSPFLGLGDGGGGMGLNAMLRPTEMLMRGAIKKLLPKKSTAMLQRMDKSLPYHFTRAMSKLGAAKNSGGVLGFLADTFGLDPAKSAKITFGDYNKGAVQWDGYSKKALEEVIPFYLSRIDAGINKTDRMIYNYKSGSFKTEHQAIIETQEALDSDIQKQFAKMFDQIDSVMRLSDSTYRTGWTEDSEKKTRATVSKMASQYSRDRGKFFSKDGSRRTSTMRDADNNVIKDKNGKDIQFTREKYLMYQINDLLKGYQFKSLNGKEKSEIADALYDQITQAEEMSANSDLARSIVKSSDSAVIRDLLANGKLKSVSSAINRDPHQRFSLYDIQVRDDVLNADTTYMKDQHKARLKAYSDSARRNKMKKDAKNRASGIIKNARSKYSGGVIGKIAELSDTFTENAKEFQDRLHLSGVSEKINEKRDRLDEVFYNFLVKANGSVQNLANMDSDDYALLVSGGLDTIRDFFNSNFDSPYDFDPNADVIYESEVPEFFKHCGLDASYYDIVYATDKITDSQYFVSAALVQEPESSGSWTHWPRIITLDMIKNRNITEKDATRSIKWNCEETLSFDIYKAIILREKNTNARRRKMDEIGKHAGTSTEYSKLLDWYSNDVDSDYLLYNKVKKFVLSSQKRRKMIERGESPKNLEKLSFSLSGLRPSTEEDYTKGGLVLNNDRKEMIENFLRQYGGNSKDIQEVYRAFSDQFTAIDTDAPAQKIAELTAALNNAKTQKEKQQIQAQLKNARRALHNAKANSQKREEDGWLKMYYDGVRTFDTLPEKIQKTIKTKYANSQNEKYLKNMSEMQKLNLLTPWQLDIYRLLESASDMEVDSGVKLTGDALKAKEARNKNKAEQDKKDLAVWRNTITDILKDASFPDQQIANITRYISSPNANADQIRRIIAVANAIYYADDARLQMRSKVTGEHVDHKKLAREIGKVKTVAGNSTVNGGIYESDFMKSLMHLLANTLDLPSNLTKKEYTNFVNTLDSWYSECMKNDGEAIMTPELELEYIGRLVCLVKDKDAVAEWFKLTTFPDRIAKKVQADVAVNHDKYDAQLQHSMKVDVRTERSMNAKRLELWDILRVFKPSDQNSYFTESEYEHLVSLLCSTNAKDLDDAAKILSDEKSRTAYIRSMRRGEMHSNNALIVSSNQIKKEYGAGLMKSAIAYDTAIEIQKNKKSKNTITEDAVNEKLQKIFNSDDLDIWTNFTRLTGKAFYNAHSPAEKMAWLKSFNKYKAHINFADKLKYIQDTDFSTLKDVNPDTKNDWAADKKTGIRDIDKEINAFLKMRESNTKDHSSALAEKWRMFEAFTGKNTKNVLLDNSIPLREKAAYMTAFNAFSNAFMSQDNWNSQKVGKNGVHSHASTTIDALMSNGANGNWQAITNKLMPLVKAGNYSKIQELLAREYSAGDPLMITMALLQQRSANSVQRYTDRNNLQFGPAPMHGPGDGTKHAIMSHRFNVNHKSIGYGDYFKNYDIDSIKDDNAKNKKLNEIGKDRGLDLKKLTKEEKIRKIALYDDNLLKDAKSYNISDIDKMTFDELRKAVSEKKYADELRGELRTRGIATNPNWTSDDCMIRLKACALGLSTKQLNKIIDNKDEIIRQTYMSMRKQSGISDDVAFASKYGVNANGQPESKFIEQIFNKAGANAVDTGKEINGINNAWTDALIGNMDTAKASAIAGMKESTSKMTEKQRSDARKKKIAGAVGALLGAGIAAKTLMTKKNLGVLSAAVCLAGPVGGGLLGLGAGIAAMQIDFKKLMFGEENLDENGNIKKKTHANLLKRIGNAIKTNIFDEAKLGIRSIISETNALIKEKISAPLARLFTPLRKGFDTVGEMIGDKIAKNFKEIGEHARGIGSKLLAPGARTTGRMIRAGSWASRKIAAGAVNSVGASIRGITNRRRVKDFKSITAEGKDWRDTEDAIYKIIYNDKDGLMKGVKAAKSDEERKAAFNEAIKQIEANEAFYNTTYGLTNAGQVLEDELKYEYDRYTTHQNTLKVKADTKQRRRLQNIRAKVQWKHGNDDFSALSHDELVDAVARLARKKGGDTETIKKIIGFNQLEDKSYFDKYAVDLLKSGNEEHTAKMIRIDAQDEENKKAREIAERKEIEEKKTFTQKVGSAVFGIWNILRGTPVNILDSIESIRKAANNTKGSKNASNDDKESKAEHTDESTAEILTSDAVSKGIVDGVNKLHDEKSAVTAELDEEKKAEEQGKNRGKWFTNRNEKETTNTENSAEIVTNKEKGESKSFIGKLFSTLTGSLGKFGQLGEKLSSFASSAGNKIAEMLPVVLKFAKPLLGLAASNPLATAGVVLGAVGLFDVFFNDRKIIKWICSKAKDLVGSMFKWINKKIFGDRDPSKGWESNEIQSDGMVKQESTYLTGGRDSSASTTVSAPGQSNYLQGNTSVGTGFLQGDPRWGNKRIGTFANGKPATMENAGCVYTAISDALNPSNRSVGTGPTPDEVAATALANGEAAPDGSGTAAIINRYGGRSISDSATMLESLRRGNPVIISGQSAGYGPAVDVFPSTNEHVVTAQGIDANGNAIVDNPMYGRQVVPFNQLAQQTHAAWSVGYGAGDGINHNITGKENVDYTFYSQKDPRWAKLKTGPQDTVGSTGCLLTSQAMGATLLNGGSPITPADLAPIWEKYGKNGNANSETDRQLKAKYGIELGNKIMLENVSKDQLNASVNQVNKALASGYPVDFHGNPKKNPLHSWRGKGATSGSHNMLIYGVDESGNWLVLDPGTDKTTGRGRGTALRANPAEFAQNGHWMRIMSKNGQGVTKFENQAAMNNQITVGGDVTSGNGAEGSGGGFNIMNIFSKITRGIGAIANSALKGFITGNGYQRVIGADGTIEPDVSAETVSPPESSGENSATVASPMMQTGAAPYAVINGNDGIHRAFNINRKNIISKDLGQFIEPTAEQMNAYIAKKSPDSPFVSHAQTFIDAGKKTGLDPRYLLSHAAIETGWGKSKLAREKNNYFGIQAYNDDPINSAKTFGSGLNAGIEQGAQWIKSNFYNRGQRSLESMIAGDPSHTYATYDKKDGGGPNYRWANQIAGTMSGMGFGPGPNSAEDIEFRNAGYGTSRMSEPSGINDRLDTVIELLSDIRDSSKKGFKNMNSSVGHGNDTITKSAKDKIQEVRTKNDTKAKQNMNFSKKSEGKGDLGRSRLMRMHEQIATGYRKARV